MMKVYSLKAVLFTALLLAACMTGWSQTPTYKDGVRQGRIKVKFTPEMTTTLGRMNPSARTEGVSTGVQSLDHVAAEARATTMYRLFPYDPRFEAKLRKHGLHLWYIVELDTSVDPRLAVARFRQLKEVTVAEVDRERVLAPYKVNEYSNGAGTMEALPFNDPMLKDQWHYNNTGQSGFGDADVNLFEAWKVTTGANNIIVSVHDEGVDVSHPDLIDNLWVNEAEKNGVSGVDDDGNGYVDDIHGYNFQKNKGELDAQYHGTHVAGTIAAVNNNGIGVSGIAGGNGTGNGAKIMSLQIFGNAPIERTYIYAANNGAVISQNSWGYSYPGSVEQSVLDAIDYFIAEAGDYPNSPMKGGIVIFAAGNSNSDDTWYPGYYSSTLSVAALGPEWKRAFYSNFGDWVEIAAPGGDQEYNGKSAVLSTIPNKKYAYMQGTSMACPHVSGIAALALANRNKQLTNDELWNKLVTGVVSIDKYNPDYVGKLGSGAIDAELAIRNDQGVAPGAVTTLAVTGVAQEFAELLWRVPADADDGQPRTFTLYYHTEELTEQNLGGASSVVIHNDSAANAWMEYELNGLLGLTTYYFALTSTDRWGNVSALSNIASATTNEGPAVELIPAEVTMDIDASVATQQSTEVIIRNNGAGILRYDHIMRHKSQAVSFNASSLRYPTITGSSPTTPELGRPAARIPGTGIRKAEATPMAFTPVEKSLTSYPTNLVGETDTNLPNSAMARFHVSEPEGFNLTNIAMYLKHDPMLGPVIVEVYKGTPEKSNLIHAEEYSSWSDEEGWASITLQEQLYFEPGSDFWIAFHVPAMNLFPLGIGYEMDPAYSANCFISFNVGTSWMPLELALESEDFAWSMVAASYNPYLGEYLTLEPGSGDIAGHEEITSLLSADVSTLVNGSYSANVVIRSNDAQNRELRLPVTVNVSGHQPDIHHTDILDFGSVFVGTEKTMQLVLDNQGYGNFNDPTFSVNGDQFAIDGYAPWRIGAREQQVLNIRFTPGAPGNINDVLTITNGNQTYEVALFGVGAETSRMELSPVSQQINNLSIGDVVQATVTVENTGAFPLKYFIPGFDARGISDNWPSDYHSYGYNLRTNYSTESNPLTYGFQDISSSGINITDAFRDDEYFTLDMGFEFPFYSDRMKTIYIAKKGFTTFDNSVRPVNSPTIPGNEWTPKGYISVLGSHFNYVAQGEIFYQVEADRIIIQYDNVWDGWNPESVTAQMVLYANGDIRFFYENMWSNDQQAYLTILMEDMNQSDGILLHNWENPIELYSGLALGFDYPGPAIITDVENGSGLLAPGASSTVTLTLNTSTLTEGLTNRYVNFISNDPANSQRNALIQLDVTNGGTALPEVSTDTIAFGDVFQGAGKSSGFIIKNPGTAAVVIQSMTFVDNHFIVTGETTTTIAPGLFKKYTIGFPTDNLGSFEDWLSINYADGTYDTIYLSGTVGVPPAIDVDLSLLEETLNYGETSSHPLAIMNTGLADLEVTFSGAQWLNFTTATTAADDSYTVARYNDGRFYQWIDIRETGTQMPFLDFDDFDGTFWRTLELPFPIEYYGVTYTSMKIGDNGILSFEDEPEASLFTNYIPAENHPGPCIMPYWTFSGFSDYLYPREDIGIFYQFYDDKFIITWSYFTNNFGGMGDPVSAQVIFYKNGSMKFQYKPEEGGADLTSHFSTIGLQKDSMTGIALSEYEVLDHGAGLAYVISPSKKYTVNPGGTLNGEIQIDAQNLFGGFYAEVLKITTNVPGFESLEKPVELTVTGQAELSVPVAVEFGSRIISYESGAPVQHMLPVDIYNSGVAPMEITWINMADGMQALSLQVYMLTQGWFGPEWRWVDIAEAYSPWFWPNPVFTLKPGEKLNARAVFTPENPGEFSDEVVFTTSLGEVRMGTSGTGLLPPALNVDVSEVVVNLNEPVETANRSITFGNLNGQSDLTYEMRVDYGRAIATRADESMSDGQTSGVVNRIPAKGSAPIRKASVYNSVLRHTDKETPDNFVGTGGSAPFTLATKFKAGPQGFNLSHVETYFRAENVTEGVIEVEVRAGGTINNAATIANGRLSFTGTGADEEGAWTAVPMDVPAAIYPNEEFYIVVTYPLGLEFPQGVVNNEPQTPGRYLYEDMGTWYDLQDAGDFAGTGWLMYAAEETATNSAWLTITSDLSGSLAPGAESTIDLKLEGSKAMRGDQVAQVTLITNDPENVQTAIPVRLHLNEAPYFINAAEYLVIAEGENSQVEIEVEDKEGHNFTVTPAESYSDITFGFEAGVLSIVMDPAFGTAGVYQYTFNATDEFDATREWTVTVEVLHTNRAPEFIGSDAPLTHTATGELNEYPIATFFNDPDGDAFGFTVVSTDAGVVSVYAAPNGFVLKPTATGSAFLNFEVTDAFGAAVQKQIAVEVSEVLGIEDLDRNFKITAYPNPTKDYVRVHIGGEVRDRFEIRVRNSLGGIVKKISDVSAIAEDIRIDLRDLASGVYFIEISDGEGLSMRRVVKE